MKNISFFITFIYLFAACNNSNSSTPLPPTNNTNVPTPNQIFEDEWEREEWRRGIVFRWLLDSTFYSNPTEFMNRLDTFYGLAAEGGQLSAPPSRRSLYGYPDSIFLVEYVYPNDSLCESYPYRQQFVFDAQGHLLQEFRLASLRSLPVWQDRGNVLIGVESNCQGVGNHVVYKYENGELINIFNTINIDNQIITYNSNSDTAVYLPAELTVTVQDINKDDWNDLVFTGSKALLVDEKGKKYTPKRPYKTSALRYEFLYFPGKDVFDKN